MPRKQWVTIKGLAIISIIIAVAGTLVSVTRVLAIQGKEVSDNTEARKTVIEPELKQLTADTNKANNGVNWILAEVQEVKDYMEANDLKQQARDTRIHNRFDALFLKVDERNGN